MEPRPDQMPRNQFCRQNIEFLSPHGYVGWVPNIRTHHQHCHQDGCVFNKHWLKTTIDLEHPWNFAWESECKIVRLFSPITWIHLFWNWLIWATIFWRATIQDVPWIYHLCSVHFFGNKLNILWLNFVKEWLMMNSDIHQVMNFEKYTLSTTI